MADATIASQLRLRWRWRILVCSGCLRRASTAQIVDTYGEAKDAILGASTDKVILGPITDKTTREEIIIGLLGRQEVDVDDHAILGDKATAQALQQLTWGRALVVSRAQPPAVVRFDPHWRDTEQAAA